MPMIAQASGITAGAIYKHFDSKEDLFFEVVRHAVQSIPIPTEAATAFDAATDLPRIVATYTEARLELLRQLAVEIHSASAKHPRIRRLLRRSLAARIEQLRESIDSGQRSGSLDPSVDAAMLARTVLVFILGLMHMETLVPELVGDAAWRDFIQKRTATLLGVRE